MKSAFEGANNKICGKQTEEALLEFRGQRQSKKMMRRKNDQYAEQKSNM